MKHRTIVLLLAFFLISMPLPAGELTLDSLPFGPAAGTASPLSFPDFIKPKSTTLLSTALVAETTSIASGTPFKLALRLDHAPGAYSYWTNPGGPGVATQVSWKLPQGFTISGPEWTIPQRYENAGITFYVYKGKASLLYTVTPPADFTPGTAVEIRGEVNTQICTASACNPLRQEVAVKVTGANTPGKSNPEVLTALSQLPQAISGWQFEVAGYENEIVISMHPGAQANPEPGAIYFFDAQAKPLVESQQPQRLEKDGESWWLRLPRKAATPAIGEDLTGILYAEKGWLLTDSGKTGFKLSLPISAEGSSIPPGIQRTANTQPIWILLVFAFFGGLLLNIMPCVFPVIGLKIMGFTKQAHKERRAIFYHGLAYTAGVLLCFWTLSFFVITMELGWGAQLQSDLFIFALCYIFMIMAMNMAGVFDVGASIAGAGQSAQGSEGLKRSFLTGLLATLTSTPCSAPFLGTALAYALSLPPLLALGVFTLMGIGFSLPYLALSLFPSWLQKLPKPGQWMETFRQAMCFPLFATTAYLFWTMEAMLDEWRFLMLLFGLVLTAMACWLYGRHQKSRLHKPRAARILLGSAVAALALGVWLGLPKAADSLQWQEWSPELVSHLREQGRPVYVDFTARWCATCQLNKRVYADTDLQRLLRDKNVALLKADWTLYDDRITSTLKKEFSKAAIPVTVLYKPGEPRGDLLPDILTTANVSEALGSLP